MGLGLKGIVWQMLEFTARFSHVNSDFCCTFAKGVVNRKGRLLTGQ